MTEEAQPQARTERKWWRANRGCQAHLQRRAADGASRPRARSEARDRDPALGGDEAPAVPGRRQQRHRAQRLERYTAATAAHGLPPRSWTSPRSPNRSREIAQVLLARPALPDAVLASSGLILLGLTQALRDAGRRVPGEVVIAGFDD